MRHLAIGADCWGLSFSCAEPIVAVDAGETHSVEAADGSFKQSWVDGDPHIIMAGYTFVAPYVIDTLPQPGAGGANDG